jgi:soluble lytic murein transglycosylase-like protein
MKRIIIAALLSLALIQLMPEKAVNNSTQPTTRRQIATQSEQETQENTALLSRHGAQTLDYKSSGDSSKGTETELKPESTARQVKPAVPSETGCETYRPLLEKYSWDVHIAIAVMQAESGCNPTSLSQTADRGLMQINAVHADMVNGNLNALFDPATNIQVAHRVYLSQGWKGWSAYNNGSYLKFL